MHFCESDGEGELSGQGRTEGTARPKGRYTEQQGAAAWVYVPGGYKQIKHTRSTQGPAEVTPGLASRFCYKS